MRILVFVLLILVPSSVMAEEGYHFAKVNVILSDGSQKVGYLNAHEYLLINNIKKSNQSFENYIFSVTKSDTLKLYELVLKSGDLQYVSEEYTPVIKSTVEAISPLRYIYFTYGGGQVYSEILEADTAWLYKDSYESHYLFTEDISSYYLLNFSGITIPESIVQHVISTIKTKNPFKYDLDVRLHDHKIDSLRKSKLVLYRASEI